MAGTASDQWWWNDWQGEPTLKTCSFAAQGVWMRMLCVMAEAPRKGYFLDATGKRMTLDRFAKIAGGPLDEVSALVEELGREGVYSKDRRGDIYCRKMVKAELRKKASAKGGKSGGPASRERGVGIHQQPVDNYDAETGELFDETGKTRDNLSDERLASPSNDSDISITRGGTRYPVPIPVPSREERIPSSRTVTARKPNGHAFGTVTIEDQDERIRRFVNWLVNTCHIQWPTIAAAMDSTNPEHRYKLEVCKKAARDHGKGWPHKWPTNVNGTANRHNGKPDAQRR